MFIAKKIVTFSSGASNEIVCFSHHDLLTISDIWLISKIGPYYSMNLFHSSCWHVYPLTYSTPFCLHGGHMIVLLVKTLRYKLEGCGFDS
jgi:hypothetical protein